MWVGPKNQKRHENLRKKHDARLWTCQIDVSCNKGKDETKRYRYRWHGGFEAMNRTVYWQIFVFAFVKLHSSCHCPSHHHLQIISKLSNIPIHFAPGLGLVCPTFQQNWTVSINAWSDHHDRRRRQTNGGKSFCLASFSRSFILYTTASYHISITKSHDIGAAIAKRCQVIASLHGDPWKSSRSKAFLMAYGYPNQLWVYIFTSTFWFNNLLSSNFKSSSDADKIYFVVDIFIITLTCDQLTMLDNEFKFISALWLRTFELVL